MKIMRMAKLLALLKFLSETRLNPPASALSASDWRAGKQRRTSRIFVGFYCFIASLFIFLIIHSSLITHHSLKPIFAIDEIEKISRQIDELERARQMSIEATKPLEAELDRLEDKLEGIQNSITQAEENLVALQVSIKQREADFDERYQILARNAECFYKKLRAPSPFYFLLASQTASYLIKDLSYQASVADEEKEIIAQITQDLLSLEKDRKQVELDKQRLAGLQIKVDKEAVFFKKEIKGAKEYQQSLSSQIAQLTAQQQELLAQKLSSLNLPTSLGAGPLYCTDDRKLNPGFSPAFAFFTFGIPHRVGMNQYGAYGRANAGQSYQEILQAYFNASIEKRANINIKVQGYGEMPLEQYMLGVYEVPDSWDLKALKAQAVAARSYALAYTNNGQNEICTSQACQVYKGGNKGGNWERAVKETEGEVLVSGGEVIKAWYSSTDGGYTFTSGDVWGSNKAWTKRLRDTNGDVSSFSDLMTKAYDRDSPCFYAAQGWRNEYNKSAWLKPEEVADIANVILLVRKDSSAACFVYQTDKSPPPPDPSKGCSETDNWSADKVRQELGGEALSTANSVEVTGIDWSTGKTTQITINGVAFDGSEFKNYFNLRAPANIQIVGSLYNVEKK